MAARRPGGSHGYPAQYRALAGFIAASAAFVAIFVALTLSAFHKPTPHDLPVGIVASAAVAGQVEHALDGAAPGAFSFRSYPSAASATTGIAQREVDGALVASGANLRLLVTQAGGTGPEQALNGAFTAALHVVYADHALIDSDLTGFGRTEMDEDRDEKAARVAEAAKEIAAAAGTPYTFERRQESPAEAILHAADIYAAAEPASTPVLVTGRSHHVPHRVIGSVPVRLLHESPYPVLTLS